MKKYKMSDEGRKNISDGKKRYYKNNPDKHNWKSKKSIPCEIFKNFLKQNNINFIEEYQPLPERFFSIDIAFPDKRIGIEINGNQHYSSDGTLSPYYLERHNLIEQSGWKLYEYHFSVCYDSDMLQKIVFSLINEHDLKNIDYSFFIKKKIMNFCVDCMKEVSFYSKRCIQCENKRREKNIPSLQDLEKLLENNSYCSVGRMFGVSDNAIRKWIKKHKNICPSFPQ